MTDPNLRIETITAPWTPEQVAALNDFQQAGVVHPFTCGTCRAVLRATVDGWVCDHDDYRQTWAHAFMADPAAHPSPHTWSDTWPLIGPNGGTGPAQEGL